MTFGGKCLNCGYNPEAFNPTQDERDVARGEKHA
jgi:hypothetical protein